MAQLTYRSDCGEYLGADIAVAEDAMSEAIDNYLGESRRWAAEQGRPFDADAERAEAERECWEEANWLPGTAGVRELTHEAASDVA